MSKEKVYKIIIIVLSVLLAITSSLLVVQVIRRAKLSSDSDSVKNNTLGAVDKTWVFSAENFMPGDSESKQFEIELNLESDAEVAFCAMIENDEKNLADVLSVRVENEQSKKVVCEGVLSEISGKKFYENFVFDGTKELQITYKITVTFSTSAGNEYSNANVEMNFKWTLSNGGDEQ